MALMTAYFSGLMAARFQFAPKDVPSYNAWRDELTSPPRPISSADRLAAFAALAEHGFDIKITEH